MLRSFSTKHCYGPGWVKCLFSRWENQTKDREICCPRIYNWKVMGLWFKSGFDFCFSKATQFRLTPICINTKECPCSQFSHTLTSSYTHGQPPPAQTDISRPILSHAWGLSATFSMAPSLQQGQWQAASPHSQVSALTLPPPPSPLTAHIPPATAR